MACCGQRKVYTRANPLIVGTDEGDTVEIIASVNSNGMRAGQTGWVRGSHVQALLDKGWWKRI